MLMRRQMLGDLSINMEIFAPVLYKQKMQKQNEPNAQNLLTKINNS